MRRLIPAIIAILMLFSCAQAAVCFRADDAYALLDRDGAVIAPFGAYSEIIPIDRDLFAAKRDGKYALIDGDGMRHTDFLYDEMKSAGSGFIMIRKDHNWGIMESGGSVLHECAYSRIIPSGTGAFWAFTGIMNDAHADPLMILEADGKTIGTDIRALDADASLGSDLLRALLPDQNRYGYIDAAGRIAIAAQFDYAERFTNGIAAVVLDGSYGAIDMEGNFVLEPAYAALEISDAGTIAAMDGGGNVALYNLIGQRINRMRAAFFGTCGKYVFAIDDDSTAVFNAEGRCILSLSPAAAISAGIGEDLILSDGAWGEECAYLVGTNRRYQHIYPLGTANERHIYAYMTIAAARYNNDMLGEIQYSTDPTSARYGLIDDRGNILLDAQYKSIEYLDDDRFRARTDDQWQLIASDGSILFSCAAADEEASSE